MGDFILSIDQGTTSSRAIVFDGGLAVRGSNQLEFAQHFPADGWVEHEPEDIWRTSLDVSKAALEAAEVSPADVASIGITNQRETTLVWDRDTGEPIYRAIVWQDRRTAGFCARLKADGAEQMVTDRTGLLLDPYFSATKIAWILDNVEGARSSADAGRLCFGTVDSFLLWRLTDGAVHASDATNASRTMLYDIHKGEWSDDLLKLFNVPRSMLPEVRDCADSYGVSETGLLGGGISIGGIAGDQQAATVGQACFEPGMMKSTYGTGCFALLNTGNEAVTSQSRLLTTIAYQLEGTPTYALEGSIFIAGAAVQWLRDGLQIIDNASESGGLAHAADDGQSIYLVPAFTGLGAPYWDAECRGAVFGITRGTGRAEFARAALEAVCYQTRDLLEAMQADWAGAGDTVLRVDGGMVASDWTMQRLADILNAPVDRPNVLETTAVGAAYLAGLNAGVCAAPSEFAQTWSSEKRFEPGMTDSERERKYAGWKDAVSRTLSRCPSVS